jgi:hypothetical protein
MSTFYREQSWGKHCEDRSLTSTPPQHIKVKYHINRVNVQRSYQQANTRAQRSLHVNELTFIANSLTALLARKPVEL